MSDITQNFEITSIDLGVTVDTNQLTFTPDGISLNIYAGGVGTSNSLNADIANVHIYGGTNGYVLQTDGTGNLDWTAMTGGGGGNGTPGGANTQVQYNDSGSFGGSAGFTFNEVTGNLNVPGNIIASNLTGNVGTFSSLYSTVITSNAFIANSFQLNADAIAIGNNSSVNDTAQGVSIGFGAGAFNPGGDAIAIGDGAGGLNQGSNSVALGSGAGRFNQGESSLALGFRAGINYQSNNSIILNASGANLDQTTANSFTVKPVRNANTSTFLFYNNTTGEITYDNYVASNANYASFAGYVVNSAQSNITSLGTLTGLTASGNITTSGNIVARQFTSNVATGNAPFIVTSTTQVANLNVEFANTVTASSQPNITSLGTLLRLTTNFLTLTSANVVLGLNAVGNSSNSIAIGVNANAGFSSSLANNIAIGRTANASTGNLNIAIGDSAFAGNSSISIGRNAGGAPASFGVAIGVFAGRNSSSRTVAIGYYAGNINQANNAIAIGHAAGDTTQGLNSIAIGAVAGSNIQGNNSVAIGWRAGENNQGSNSIAIGTYTGILNQPNNSIILNATGQNSGVGLNGTQANSFFVKPIRDVTGNVDFTVTLKYNPTTGEIGYV